MPLQISLHRYGGEFNIYSPYRESYLLFAAKLNDRKEIRVRIDPRDIIGETEAMALGCRNLSQQAQDVIPEEEWEALKHKYANI